MTQIKWQDFLNILTLKGKDTGVLDKVKRVSEDQDKFVICYHANKGYLEEWLAKRTKIELKSATKSAELRLNGNKVYQSKNDKEALHLYNESVIAAPFNSNEFALALANRSAVLVRLGYDEEAIRDIDLALQHSDSQIPRSKLLTRKGVLFNKLNMFEECLQLVESLYPDEEKISLQENTDLKNAYENAVRESKKKNSSKVRIVKEGLPLPICKGGENTKFPCASANVSLKFSKEKGRHVMANKDIAMSDVIFVEKPFALVVLPEQYQEHCHHCCKKTVAFIPCEVCTRALFCSVECQNKAWSLYHQWECRGLDVCHSIGIAHLGLRVALLADSSARYKQVSDLNTHLEDMKNEDVYQYAITAALLTLYLEQYTLYFKCNVSIDAEKMGCRILRHIAHMICNGHAITKIDSLSIDKGFSKTISEDKQRIATAIYPSASMMNHSCDQNISNSFINEHLIVRAAKPIKKGEEVFNCYGPHYTRMSRDERQSMLQSQYFFTCDCKKCTDPVESEVQQYSALLRSYYSNCVCLVFTGPHYTRMSRDERQSMLQSQYFFTCDCKKCTDPVESEMQQYSALLRSYYSNCVCLVFTGPHYTRMSRDERQSMLQSQYFFTCDCKKCSDPVESKMHQYSALLRSYYSNRVCLVFTGPHYTRMSRDERQSMLQSQYFFTCDCKKCSDPVESEMQQYSALLCSYCAGPVMRDRAACADCLRTQPLFDLVNMALTAQEAYHRGVLLMCNNNTQDGRACFEECVKLSTKCLYKHNSDLRTYKDALARAYAELGRYDESIALTEECILSVEKQFGINSPELSSELMKLFDLISEALSVLVLSKKQNSEEYRRKLKKLKAVQSRVKTIIEATMDTSYLNSIPGMAAALKSVDLS